ncbi:bifunctional FolD 1 domain protein [Mycobacterium xenopi 4042]|uniref:Bifunctional FolD 1 domain protein n=1 Tax=Mycobacterium xenopi 4042 TaxID=1299334 RepID=X7YIU2_MYCXE|nr:bifunctional FolD 1 domain protein [Mycobacterium xenopi 4042]
MSAVTRWGTPTAATMISACRVSAARSRVAVWHKVTVAFSVRRVSSRPNGRPTVTPRPMTTAWHPRSARRSAAAGARCRARCTATGRGAEHQPAQVRRVQTVDILRRVDALQRRVLVEVLGQRQLHDVTGAVGVSVQFVDGLVKLGLADVGRQVAANRRDAHLVGIGMLART